MKNWWVLLTAGGKSRVQVKIQRGIFQGDALFVLSLIPLNHILGKCTSGYKLNKLQEKINHLMYMEIIKRFAKNE